MNKNTRFLIVEDELLIAEVISDILIGEGCQSITSVTSVEEAISHIEIQGVDFVLTDIALGRQKTGVDLGEYIHNTTTLPFIYITSHADSTTIEKAKHTHPSAYIVKPFKKEDLLIAIELALYNNANSLSKLTENTDIFVKEGRAIVRLSINSITYLESDGNYTSVYLNEGKRHVVRITLADFELQLPQLQFIRIHKSFIVNKNYVTKIATNNVMIKDTSLSIGRSFQQNIKHIFG